MPIIITRTKSGISYVTFGGDISKTIVMGNFGVTTPIQPPATESSWRLPITIDSASLLDNLENWTFVFDQSFIGALTSSNGPLDADGTAPMKSDGSDIRLSYDISGSILMAIDVRTGSIDNDPTNGTLEIATKIPNLYTASINTIYMWWGDSSLTMSAADGTYGQYNAYDSFHILVMDMRSWVDRTLYGIDFDDVGAGSPTVGDTGGPLGRHSTFEDGIEYQETTIDFDWQSQGTGNFTWEALVKQVSDTAETYQGFMGQAYPGPSFYFKINSGNWGYSLDGAPQAASPWPDSSSYHHAFITKTGTGTNEVEFYLDGAADGTGTEAGSLANDTMNLGTGRSQTGKYAGDSLISEVRIHLTDRSAAWANANYNNFFNSDGFIVAGEIEAATMGSASIPPDPEYTSSDGVYFVSNDGDNSNTGTSTTSSWLTIQYAANTMTSSSKVIVLDGLYEERVHVTGSNVTFEGQSTSSTYSSGGFFVEANNITVKGFDIKNDVYLDSLGTAAREEGSGVYIGAVSGCLVENNYIHDTTMQGIIFGTWALQNSGSSNCIARNNKMIWCAFSGIQIWGNNNLIENNDISHIVKYGVNQNATSSTTDADGFWGNGDGHIYRGNWVHDIYHGDQITGSNEDNHDCHIDCFQTSGPLTNTVFDGNFFHNPNTKMSDHQVFMFQDADGTVGDITFKNNVFINKYAIINVNTLSDGSIIPNFNIYNNTFFGDHGDWWAITLMGCPDSNVKNNNFINCGSGSKEYMRWYDRDGEAWYGSPSASDKPNMDYNSHWDETLTVDDDISGSHDIFNVDPQVVDISTLNFRLTSGSGLIDTGSFITSDKYILPITIDSASIEDNLINWTLVFDQTFIGALTASDGPLDADGTRPMKSDGRDIRISFDEAGNTEMAVDVRTASIDDDPANGILEIATKVPNVYTASINKIYMRWGDSSKLLPAANSTYGQYNAYDEYHEVVLPFRDWNDRTSNQNHFSTVAQGDATNNVSGGLIGNHAYFDGNDIQKTPSSVSHDIGTGTYTLEALLKRISDTANSWQGIWGNGTYSPSWQVENSDGNWGLYSGANRSAASTWPDLTDYHHAVAVRTGTGTDELLYYLDSVTDGTNTDANSMANAVGHLAAGRDSTANCSDIRISEFRLHSTNRSSAWISANYKNITNSASFLEAGTIKNTVIIDSDYDGNSRPQGDDYDIGAFEYVEPSQTSSYSYTSSDGVYFVSNEGDNSNTGTSVTSSWLTIHYAADTMVSGNTVIVLDGTYEGKVELSGTSGLTFQGHSTSSTYSSGGFFIDNVDNITIDGFNINNDVPIDGWGTTQQEDGSGILVDGATNVTVKNNYIHTCTLHGIYVRSDVTRSLFTNNIITACGFVGIETYGSHISYSNNDISHIYQTPPQWTNSPAGDDADGIRFFGNQVVFKANYVHDIYLTEDDNATAHIDCIQTWGPATNITFDGNFFHNPLVNNGMQASMIEQVNDYVSDLTFINNIFIAQGGLLVIDNKTNQGDIPRIKVYNNTFFGSGYWAVQLLGAPTSSVKNNLFFNCGNAGSREYLRWEDDTGGSGSSYEPDYDYNWMYHQSGSSDDTLKGTHDIFDIDPLLVDPNELNFRPQSSSGVINTGSSDVSSSVLYDYDGISRPQGTGYDIGAFESALEEGWYVDKDASGSNDGTSWTDAWESFADINWSSVSAGDIVYISGGTTSKTYYETLTPTKSGTSGSIITVTKGSSAGHNGEVIIDGEDTRVYCIDLDPGPDYLTVSYITVKNPTDYGIRCEETNYVTLDHITYHTSSTIGMRIVSNDNLTVSYYDFSTVTNSTSQTDGMQVNYNSDFILEYSTIKILNSGTSHNDAFQKNQGYGYDNGTIRYNYFDLDNTDDTDSQGVFLEDASGTWNVYNNVIDGHDYVKALIKFKTCAANTTLNIYNNTIIAGSQLNADGKAMTFATDLSGCTLNFKNNIVVMTTSDADLMLITGTWTQNRDYNIWWTDGGASYPSTGSNSYTIDPELNASHQPTSSSPSVDNGVDLSGSFTDDIDGISRPQGDDWDIGAYEYIS